MLRTKLSTLMILRTLLCGAICLIGLSSNAWAQSINANFEQDDEGWQGRFTGYPAQGEEGYELFVGWHKLPSPFSQRAGIQFVGKNYSNRLFLWITRPVEGLLPNTNYKIIFNMDWMCLLASEGEQVHVKVGALPQEPEVTSTGLVEPSFRAGDLGRSGRDLIKIASLKGASDARLFQQNVHNYDQVFYANTNEEGALWLIIGIEPEQREVRNVFLNTLRVVLAENGEAREMSSISSSKVIFYPNISNTVIFFESEYNSEIEMVNIYTHDNHLLRVYTYKDSFTDRAFQTTDLDPGLYRIEFVLRDGRTISKSHTVE